MAIVLLVEGTCGAGKSTLIDAVADHARRNRYRVSIFTQRRTYAPIAPSEDAGTLTDAENLRELRAVVDEIDALAEDATTEHLILVDTLHVTQHVRPGILSARAFQRIDAALRQLGTRGIFLRADLPTLFARAVVARRGTGFLRYASKFAASERGLAEHFCAEQVRMMAQIEKASDVPWSILDSESDVHSLVEATWCLALDRLSHADERLG